MNQVNRGENGEGDLQLKDKRVSLDAHKIALLKDVFENQDLEKNSAA